MTPQLTWLHRTNLYENLRRQAPRLDPKVLSMALDASRCAAQSGRVLRRTLSIIDYSLPSTEQRLWVFDLQSQRLLFRELVAHGINTGENWATDFSNRLGSRQSSLGLFLTDRTYIGRNGYSLKLHGLENGINDRALERTIVLHGAWYVSEAFARENGRLGRSWGCPAVKREVAKPLIDTIKEGGLLFIYYPDGEWLASSDYLNGCEEDDETPTAWTSPHAAYIDSSARTNSLARTPDER